MGTYCTLKSATVEQLGALMRHPAYLPYFYDPESAALPTGGFFRRLFGGSTELPAELRDLSACMEISLDKAWDGLNYVFTHASDEDRAALILEGGTRLSENARLISPDELREFRDLVHSTSEDELRAAYNPDDMASSNVYPAIIWQRELDEAFDWLMESHQRLWAFLRDAVEEGHGSVIWIAG